MGGVQFSTLYVAQELDRTRLQPLVICPEEGDLTRACREAGVDVKVIPHPRLLSTSVRVGRNRRLPNPFAWAWNAAATMRAEKRLRSFLRESRPDVLVTKGLSSHFIGGLAARRLKIPCVWHVQDLISERNFGIYRRIFATAAKRLPLRVIVDGAAIKNQLPRALASRIRVVHNGVDTDVFRPELDGSLVRRELGIAHDQVVIGHAARITPWKGQHYLIEAFARIANEHRQAVLLIAGSPVFDHDGYERRLRKMADEFGLTDRVKFAGYRRDLPYVLAAMDIFAYTSIEKDTSPLALLSAMAAGLPIIAFDIEGVRELIDDEATLLTVPVANVDVLARTLGSLISDVQLRRCLAEAARRVAVAKFGLQRYILEIESELVAACSQDIATPDAERRQEVNSKAPATNASTVSAVGS